MGEGAVSLQELQKKYKELGKEIERLKEEKERKAWVHDAREEHAVNTHHARLDSNYESNRHNAMAALETTLQALEAVKGE